MRNLILKTIGTVFLKEGNDYRNLRCRFENVYIDEYGNTFTDDWKMHCEIRDTRYDIGQLRLPGNQITIDQDFSQESEFTKEVSSEIIEFMNLNNIEKISEVFVIMHNESEYTFYSQSAVKAFILGLNLGNGYNL